MNTKEAIKYINFINHHGFKEEDNGKKLENVIELLQRGEINQKIIDKMKNEKYDVWISLPGSFTNIPKFIRDIEKEVNND